MGDQKTTTLSVRRFLGKCKHCKNAMRLELEVERTRTETRTVTVSGSQGFPKVQNEYRVLLPSGRSIRNFGFVPSLTEVCVCGAKVNMMCVTGKVNPDIKCNARCRNATGHTCECSCGGKNHGGNH